jgi:hypothetical protein
MSSKKAAKKKSKITKKLKRDLESYHVYDHTINNLNKIIGVDKSNTWTIAAVSAIAQLENQAQMQSYYFRRYLSEKDW